MSLKNRRYRVNSRKIPGGFSDNRRKGGWRRIFVPVLVICAVVVAVLVGADYLMNHGKIYPGVSVESTPLGGKPPEEARRILEESTRAFEEV